ncbi:MAG TPA: SUF system Fe-S cluster assembly regulator [Patescibacteria group bacterium]|nr:SUF system Fe-S cluster assembly regulator [Patescibacteria group bacterium]
MLRVSRKADYALIALKHLAQYGHSEAWSAADISSAYGISAPLLAKVLQRLAKGGLVHARHGSSGGYTLARDPASITALEVVQAIDGPISITSCSTHGGDCDHLSKCTVREPLRRINDSVLQVLKQVTLLQLADEEASSPVVGITN